MDNAIFTIFFIKLVDEKDRTRKFLNVIFGQIGILFLELLPLESRKLVYVISSVMAIAATVFIQNFVVVTDY